MKSIKSFAYNKNISHSFNEKISVNQAGIYAIEITASAKSWWQNTITRRSFLLKDSLTIVFDGLDIISSLKKKKLLADDIWNGNILQGHELTLYLLTHLEAKQYTLSCNIHGQPFIKNINVSDLENQSFELKQLAPKKRDRTPWLTLLIGERLTLTSLSIVARAEKRSWDDDDLSLRIDGALVWNEDARVHKEWYWCGKSLKGVVKKFSKQFDVTEAPSRINVSADGTPEIEKLSCILQLSQSQNISRRRPRLYKPGQRGENYNIYDDFIAEAVERWNKEFLSKDIPVPEPLDPSLVKAIAYQESRLGYGANSVNYPAYPDIMQVGDVRNPAIHVLQSEKGFEEYEWNDTLGKSVIMSFDHSIAIKKPEDSISWGVRWLFHKAQYVQNNRRNWKTWSETVEAYHKKGDAKYRKSVMKIYKQGIDGKGVMLWFFSIGFIILMSAALTAFGLSSNTLTISKYEVGFKSDAFKNGEYSIDGRRIKLRDGFHIFLSNLSDSAKEEINPYDNYDGPYSVQYEQSTTGDMNNDGIQDGVVVLNANYGGTGNYVHLAALISGPDDIHHVGSVVYDDRDVIRDISIKDGIIKAVSIVHGDDDPLCCPSMQTVREFTLIDFIPE